MPARRFQVFDHETASALSAAFEEAWQALQEAGLQLPTSLDSDRIREILVLRIIDLAQDGERDVARLRDGALSHLADAGLSEQN